MPCCCSESQPRETFTHVWCANEQPGAGRSQSPATVHRTRGAKPAQVDRRVHPHHQHRHRAHERIHSKRSLARRIQDGMTLPALSPTKPVGRGPHIFVVSPLQTSVPNVSDTVTNAQALHKRRSVCIPFLRVSWSSNKKKCMVRKDNSICPSAGQPQEQGGDLWMSTRPPQRVGFVCVALSKQTCSQELPHISLQLTATVADVHWFIW